MIENVKKFVASLDPDERMALMRELLQSREANCADMRLSQTGLLEIERWFWERATLPAPQAFQHSRVRLWLIFMLLRYGGLRIKEIFQLTEKDCFFSAGYIQIDGRKTPLPPRASRLIADIWQKWPGRFSSAHPFACDASVIRRGMADGAKACGIAPETLNASALRKRRALELQAQGLAPVLAAFFLGKTRDPAPFAPASAQAIIERHIQREGLMKTSARNVFRGQISEIEERGILAKVVLATPQGLNVAAIITKTSLENLKLAKGIAATALVKAPWVSALAVDDEGAKSQDNCFIGKVEKIIGDEVACETSVALPSGDLICALDASAPSPPAGVKEGSNAMICFSAFSVILTVD